MKRILGTIFLALASVGAMAQTLSVESVEVEKGKQAEIVVRASEVSDATALQFNLSLPKGFSLVENGATMGAASNGHLLIVETLGNGDHLLVIYSMDLKTFGEGELLRLPVTAGDTAGSFSGYITVFRTATADAVSHTGKDAAFPIKVTDEATAIDASLNDNGKMINDNYYSIEGKKLNGEPTQKGVYIVNGKKVVK